ncbi:hypothetical protein BJV82DRAFT_590411 [Fennellomyces sp. T-0311]|nr:hypothetical protein BJV82DRAFT_590411 [Fennellomyces sp. T-0311]
MKPASRARVLRRLAAASLKKMNPTEMPAREEPLRRTVLIRRTLEWVKQQQRQLDLQEYDLDSTLTYDPMMTLPRYVEEDPAALLTPEAYDWSWLGDDRLYLTQIISTPPAQPPQPPSTEPDSSLLSHTIQPPEQEQEDDLNILLWNYRQAKRPSSPDDQDLSTKRVKTTEDPPAGPASPASSPVILSV